MFVVNTAVFREKNKNRGNSLLNIDVGKENHFRRFTGVLLAMVELSFL